MTEFSVLFYSWLWD